MGNKDRAPKMQKKPKKDAKAKIVTREEPVSMTVELVKRKRKETLADA